MFTFEWALILPVMMRMLHHQGFQLLLGMPPQPTNTPIRCNKPWRHHLTERVVRNSHDAFTDTVRFPPDPPAAPQSAQVPLPGFSTSLFTRCLFTTWSEVIVAGGSALILLLGGRNPPTPGGWGGELTRPFRSAGLLQSGRIVKHGAAHTLLSKGHLQHSRASGSVTPPAVITLQEVRGDTPFYSPVSSCTSFHFSLMTLFFLFLALFCMDTT